MPKSVLLATFEILPCERSCFTGKRKIVSKILPPTSLKVPLVARFILFTFITNVVTIASTVLVIARISMNE